MADFPVVKTVAVPNVTPIQAKHINNLEDKVGIDGDTNPSSLDYQVNDPTNGVVPKFNADHDASGHHSTGVWQIGATPVTSTASELNKLTGTTVNVSPANLNLLTGGTEIGGLNLHSHGKYLLIQDSKASGTNGGSFASAGWKKRDLTLIAIDEVGIAPLAANQFVLPAGTYICDIIVPAVDVGKHKTRLQNITGAVTTLLGSSGSSGTSDDDETHSFIKGKFTIGAPTTFEVQHQCSSAFALATGKGRAGSFGVNEIYTQVQLIKVA